MTRCVIDKAIRSKIMDRSIHYSAFTRSSQAKKILLQFCWSRSFVLVCLFRASFERRKTIGIATI